MKFISSKSYGIAAALIALVLWCIGLFYLKGMGHGGLTWNLDGWFKWHVIMGGIGILVAAVIVIAGYRRVLQLTPYIAVVALFMLVWTLFVPEVIDGTTGETHNLASELILSIGGHWITLLPAELAKIAFIMVLAYLLPKLQRRFSDSSGELYSWLPLLAFGGLMALQGDFKNIILLILITVVALFALGLRPWRSILLIIGSTAGMIGYIHYFEPLRWQRCVAWWFPEEYANDYAYQLWKSLCALRQAGWCGNGINPVSETVLHLPEAHSSLMLSTITFQSGWIMLIAVTSLYALLATAGFLVAHRCQSQEGKILCFGATAFLFLQALFSLGVVTGCLPTWNLTAPFIGFGGSNLVFCFVALGFILSVARENVSIQEEAK